MTSSGCTYRFIESSLSLLPKEIEYDIEIRQQPVRAKMSIVNERDKRNIEPPPILQLHFKNCTNNELKKCLQSPFYYLVVNLVNENDPDTLLLPIQKYLSGSTVSSLYRLKDVDNSDGGFFVFGDLAVKKEGKFKLKFSLFEIVDGQVQNRKTLLSDTFTVYIPKQYPGPIEATFLSRTFSDQGVKMKIRKEHRMQAKKRKIDKPKPTKKKIINNKTSNMIISNNPSYAENHKSSTDVLFGRWQAININDKQDNYNHFPSPENSVDHHRHSLLSNSPSQTTYHSLSVNSPPPPTMSFSHSTPFVRLPTPPIVTDLNNQNSGNNNWKLPPLRSIIVDDFGLPPPPTTLLDHPM